MYNNTLENLHLGEITLIRKALDNIPITGADAKFVAALQTKVESKIEEINKKSSTPKSK